MTNITSTDWDIQLEWINGIHFIAKNQENHTIDLDGSTHVGGQELGIRPMQTVLSGLAGCAAIDVVLMLNKSKQSFHHLSVQVYAERAESIPMVFNKIHLQFVIQGDVKSHSFNRFVELSIEKYCSVAAMLNKSATITWTSQSS